MRNSSRNLRLKVGSIPSVRRLREMFVGHQAVKNHGSLVFFFEIPCEKALHPTLLEWSLMEFPEVTKKICGRLQKKSIKVVHSAKNEGVMFGYIRDSDESGWGTLWNCKIHATR